jgi:serine/threonine protein kinase
MSPEQMASSRDVDGRTDIWALGAILYELIAGQPPFIADSLPQLCTLILNGPPAPLRALCPQVPPGLEAVILRCLEKTPPRRYANISEFATALADFGPRRARLSVERVSRVINSANLSASGAVIGGTLPNATGSQTGGSWSDTKANPPKGSRKTLFIGLGLLVGIGAVLALFVVRRGGLGASVLSGTAGAAPTPPAAVVAPPAKHAAVPSSTLTPIPTTVPAPTPVPAPLPEKPALTVPAPSEAPRGSGRKPPIAHPPVVAHPVASAPAAPAKPPAAVDLFDDRK